MSLDDLTSSMMVAGTTLLASRAGLFLRVLMASLVFLAVTAAARRLLSPGARVWAHVGTSTVLVAILATPLFAAIALVYFVAFHALVERLPRGWLRTIALVLAVALQVIAPILWLPPAPDTPLLVRELDAFTTNMTQLRCWSYAWDRSHEDAPSPSLRDHLHYMTFFPAFVGGPLLSFREFQAGRLDWYWRDRPAQLGDDFTLERRAWVRIALGVVASLAAIQFVPVLSIEWYTWATQGPVPAWAHAIGVYLAVYLGFSAWSEAAIGSGRLAGIVLPENFDYAHRSYGVADFWRRWNIRLGWWMREYVYLPLGGSRRLLWRNTAAVFLATAVYHHVGGFKLVGEAPLLAGPMLLLRFDYYAGWLGWAVLNTAGTLATRRWHPPTPLGVRGIAVIVATMLFSCVALQTAFFPAWLPWTKLFEIYRALVVPVST